jgi:hypothetical protein
LIDSAAITVTLALAVTLARAGAPSGAVVAVAAIRMSGVNMAQG